VLLGFFAMTKVISSWFKPTLLIAFLSVGLFGLANFQAFVQIARYDRAISGTEVEAVVTAQSPAGLFGDVAGTASPSPQPAVIAEPDQQRQSAERSVATPSRLAIPSIGLIAPMVWNIEEQAVQRSLQRGLVHYKGTAKPGQEGNMVVFGHSSDYFWKRNPYATIFALLPKVAIGDLVTVTDAQGVTHQYRVDGKKVVSPFQRSVMEYTPGHQLTLITCYPVGTSLNRYIITAQLVSR
jgi:LPXTG-site transpeptidase (sortase) family protein